MPTPNQRGALIMGVAMAGFSVSDACMKGLGAEWPLMQSLAVRGAITTLVLLALGAARGELARPRGRDAALVGLRTLCEVAASWFYLSAILRMPIANVSAIQQAVPLTVTLAAALAFGERPGRGRLAAILVGLGGVLLIVRPGAEGFDASALLVLGSVAAVTVRDIAARALSPGLPSLSVAAAAGAGVAAFGALGSIGVEWQPLTGRAAALLAGTVSAVVLGYVGAVAAMRVGEVAAVTPFRYASLLGAIALGALVWGTWPDAMTLLGAAVVVGAGIWTLRARARARPEDEAPPGA